ncbi:SusC/RagA family TonB-linked outer membrane protein [Flavihumibacter sp. RY-1]|uniref:SusC/RagA family TonB-linked outer membrane protein n=1 Tax=Flavihumibacter fluminis TaxID=2909236 RepID=A0ABS9BDC1_9BACT|nr:SusC/RagA family TonB-linked outer membrane protein [Flavihumibacter fluminis]MCF1713698.1 SusC/RagA family TonB-linked outer membrane protein [Flavihumibacter fluminis]
MKKLLTRSVVLAIMKFSVLPAILLSISILTHAHTSMGQEVLNKKVSIDFYQAEIRTCLHEIEKQAAVKFVYSPELIRSNRKVTIKSLNKELARVLEELLFPLDLKYELVNNYIVLSRKSSVGETLVIEGLSGLNNDEQQRVIKGKVVSENGQPMEGVSILEKNTSNGTVTDQGGAFSIGLLKENGVLVFSYIGYQIQEVAITGNNILTIQMQPEVAVSDSVIVTAFGIRKSSKSLTYSAQKVDGKLLNSVGNPNVLNSLQGKAAGVSVRLSSGMPGRAPQINIRGARSMTGNNQPLFVVDGLPVSGGERALDFNPADIENMDILKGPAASALYGLRAANGVIVITTKSGKNAQKSPRIIFDNSSSFDKVSVIPDLQNEYAQGQNDEFNQNAIFAWGSRIDKIGSYTNLLGETEEARAYDNARDFYETGTTINNNLELSQGISIGNYSFSIGNTSQSGIIKGTNLQRNSLRFSGNFEPFSKFKLGISVNYTDSRTDDFPDNQGNGNLFRGVIETPPSYNLAGKPYARSDNPNAQIFYRTSQNNPYWVVENNYRKLYVNRLFGNILTEYRILPDFKLTYRLGIDYFSNTRNTFEDLGTAPAGFTSFTGTPAGGFIEILNTKQEQVNSNLFLTYDKRKGDFTYNFIVGNEIYDIQTRNELSQGFDLISPDLFNLSNASRIQASNSLFRQRVVGFYGNASVGWKNRLFLTASGRNDLVSNMPSNNRSFFYPSLGLSYVFTESFPALGNVINFGKLRVNWAEVGQAGPLYVNNVGYSAFNSRGGLFQFPFNGVVGFVPSQTTISKDLMPENTSSYELGFDLRFFNDRIGLDYTYFRSVSDGQIVSVPLTPSSGAAQEVRNAGRMSSYGHEVTLRITPIRNRSFNWDFTTNFTSNRTYVDELSDGLTRIVLAQYGTGLPAVVAQPGYQYGSLLGLGYLRDPSSGQIVVNSASNVPTSGMPLLSQSPMILGTSNPDFEVNFLNSFRYKSLTFGFQLDWRQGGVVYMHDLVEARFRGVAGETRDRDVPVVLPGKKGRLVNGSLFIDGDNDISIFRKNTYYSGAVLMGNIEAQLNDASFVRLREINLSYSLPQSSLLKRLRIKNADLYFMGRNLFLNTKAFTDPEGNFTNMSGQSTGNANGILVTQTPQTKSFGGGLRITW